MYIITLCIHEILVVSGVICHLLFLFWIGLSVVLKFYNGVDIESRYRPCREP